MQAAPSFPAAFPVPLKGAKVRYVRVCGCNCCCVLAGFGNLGGRHRSVGPTPPHTHTYIPNLLISPKKQ